MALLNSLLYTAAAFVAYYIVKRVVNGLRSPLYHVPGPWHTRFTPIVNRYYRFTGEALLYRHEMHKRYGPLVRFEPNLVNAVDVSSWEQMHRMGTGFRKTKFYEKLRIGPAATLFGFIDVRVHAARRKLFSRALTLEALRRNWEPAVRAKVDLCVSLIKREVETQGTAEISRWWKLMTGDVVTHLSFGESFDMLASGGASEKKYFDAVELAGVNIILSDMIPFLKFWALVLPFQILKDIVAAQEIVASKGAVAVRNLRAVDGDRPSLFSNMMAEAEKTGNESDKKESLTDDDVISEAASFMLAGTDTTSISLTYLVWAVAKWPDVRRRLEAEVATLPPNFTDKDVEALPYLSNVLAESLRLYNPGGVTIPRVAPPEGVTFNGHFLPGGTNVASQGYTLSRNESLFPDPDKFDPSRFENATDVQRRVAQPYGIGARSCIGKNLANMELRLATAVFFRECRGVGLASNMADDRMMDQMVKFFVYPRGNRCDITLGSD
ncbi:cytochrome P450 [Podospora didyma]|uniref:Cytochrome P450 n=1 Tax=Podospora didyma TaxID=330526 RepID=A0AAE0NGC7_9PEZI|nr:cytochrome P450 [Podospora didyma]